jgi:hypothetical protein
MKLILQRHLEQKRIYSFIIIVLLMWDILISSFSLLGYPAYFNCSIKEK